MYTWCYEILGKYMEAKILPQMLQLYDETQNYYLYLIHCANCHTQYLTLSISSFQWNSSFLQIALQLEKHKNPRKN